MFGGCDGLRDVVTRVSEKHAMSEFNRKVDFTLRTLKGDDAIPRLKVEVGHDHYGISKCVNPGLIVDVGANVGDFCISAAKLYPNAQVLCAEPAPETYFLLLWNLAENNVSRIDRRELGKMNRPGVIAIQGALGSANGMVNFTYNPKSSLGANVGGGPNTEASADWKHLKVRAYSLEKMLTKAKVTAVDVLKLDCEGCEFTLIPSMSEQGCSFDPAKGSGVGWRVTPILEGLFSVVSKPCV